MKMAPQAGFEPATLRLTGGKETLAALCGGRPDVAGSRVIAREIGRLLTFAFCRRLLPFCGPLVLPKGKKRAMSPEVFPGCR